MKKGDKVPLKPIQRGKGKCKRHKLNSDTDTNRKSNSNTTEIISADTCGGPTRGLCNPARICICRSGWTGPHCLVPDGFDPVEYERKEGFVDLEFTGPFVPFTGLSVGLGVMGFLALFAPMIRRNMDNWKPLSP